MAATILVMDDDECMRELLRLHLSNAGYDVLLAEDAIEAGRQILNCRPNLLLADVDMPYMNGLEFVEALRADPATSSIPIIFVTCKSEAEPRAKELGAAAFLMKPLRADQLLAAVARQVDGRVPL